jgi:hypothetical protein
MVSKAVRRSPEVWEYTFVDMEKRMSHVFGCSAWLAEASRRLQKWTNGLEEESSSDSPKLLSISMARQLEKL